MGEAFSEFKDSFSYGSRTDLTFKFLRMLSEEDAAETIRRVLEETGSLFDTGDPAAVIDIAVRTQAESYGSRDLNERYRYEDTPFTLPPAPVAESAVALLTSSGHFVEGDDPEPFGVVGMTQEEAVARIDDFLRETPQLSVIPIDTPADRLVVRQAGYDIRGAVADHQVSLPLSHLCDLESEGVVGRVIPDAYSFVGATAQGRIIKQAGPAWADLLLEAGTDVALLVPV